MRSVRLSRRARAQLKEVLAYTHRNFGDAQVGRYAALIDRALELIAADPERAGSHAYRKRPSVRLLHLEVLAGRRGAARHIIAYRVSKAGHLDVLAILHDRMDLDRHLSS